MYRSRTWSCIASRTAAAKRARRVLFPRTSQSFFSFRTSAGSFLLASLFFCGKRKGEIQDARSVRPYWPGRYCRLFSLGINSGYILDAASRTVSPRTAMRGPGKRILRVNLPVFSGSRVGARDDWPPSRRTLRGIGEGIKKEPEGCLFDFLPAHLLRWRLPTLPLAQYHRRDGA